MSAPTMAGPRTRSCASCAQAIASTSSLARQLGLGAHAGRGLCRTCWSRAVRSDTLADFPASNYSRDELLDEWTILRGQGLGRTAAAGRLGVSFAALDKAIRRAQAAGDARAVLGPP